MFLIFWRGQLFWPLVWVWYFGGFFVWVAFLLAGDRLMSFQFRKIQLPLANSRSILYCKRCLSVYRLFIFGGLWNAEVCFHPPSSLIGKFFFTYYRVLWRGSRRLEWFRSTSVVLLTRSNIRGFSTNSAMSELEVLCCLFWSVSLYPVTVSRCGWL